MESTPVVYLEKTKRCKFCHEAKPVSMFADDLRRKDKKAVACMVCSEERKKIKKEKKESRSLLRKHKIVQIAQNVADGMSLKDAYHELGTTKSRAVAAVSATNFMKSLDTSEMDIFRKMLTPEPILKGVEGFFTDVLTRALPSTIDEYNKTLNTWGKFAGTFAPERSESLTTTISEQRSEKNAMTTLEEVAKMLEEKEKQEG